MAASTLGGDLIYTAWIKGSWTMGLAGAALAVALLVALVVFDLFVPFHHDMKDHVFKPGQCEGGKLYYEGDLPILQLDGDHPFLAGKAQGYLLGEAIRSITQRFTLSPHIGPRADQIPEVLAKIREKIPADSIAELKGVVEGYNKWVSEQRWPRPKKMTVDEIVLFHLTPDAAHLKMGGGPFLRQQAVRMGCTSLVGREKTDIVFVRTMDWPSLNVLGKYSLIKCTKGRVEVSIPGMVGTLTGMRDGFCLAMNVCPSSEAVVDMSGMPTLFYNRLCLESCRNLEDFALFREQHRPLAPYHLTVADSNGAESVHFYQGTPHVIRQLGADCPLATFNSRLDKPRIDQHYTRLRQRTFDAFCRNGQKTMEAAVALPCINNYETIHAVVMKPGARVMKVAFDNGFSGDAPLKELNQRLFHSLPVC